MTPIPTYLILCDDRDPVSRRAIHLLRDRLSAPVELCSAQDLESASYFIEGRRGNQAHGEIVFRDGRILTQDQIAGLWNRLSAWPRSLASCPSGVAASLASWMRGISGPLVGEPGVHTPQACDSWSRLHWAEAATDCGLFVPPIRYQAGHQLSSRASCPPHGDRVSVLVSGETHSAVGALSQSLSSAAVRACQRLAARVGAQFLEVRMVPHGTQGWGFAEACQRPDPFSHGDGGLEVLLSALDGQRLQGAQLPGASGQAWPTETRLAWPTASFPGLPAEVEGAG